MNISATRGSASILVITLICIMVAAGVAVAVWAAMSSEHARAKTAADLGALAAADAERGVASAPDPCALAARIAVKHQARLDQCQILGGGGATVRIKVTAERSGWLAGWPLPGAHAESFAGPPSSQSINGDDAARGLAATVPQATPLHRLYPTGYSGSRT